jgi:hypothetical protein
MDDAGGGLMPMLALSDALPDFGHRPRPAPVVERPPAPIEVMPSAPPTIDVDAIIAREVEKTEASVTARLSAVYENTLQAEREKHAAELDALRADLGGRAGQLIGLRLAELEERVTSLTAASTARVLAGFASDQIQERSIAALSRAISDAMSDRDSVKVRVSGPPSLYEALRTAMGARADGFDYRETASFDLSVEIESSLFETRLAEWSRVVGEVVA